MKGTAYGLDRGPEVDWRQRAACRDADPELFYGDTAIEKRMAALVCSDCPIEVKRACLAESLDLQDWHGVRGGRTGEERRYFHRMGRWPDNPQRRCGRCGDVYKVQRPTQTHCPRCVRALTAAKIPPDLLLLEEPIRELRDRGWSQKRIADLYGHTPPRIAAACRLWGLEKLP